MAACGAPGRLGRARASGRVRGRVRGRGRGRDESEHLVQHHPHARERILGSKVVVAPGEAEGVGVGVGVGLGLELGLGFGFGAGLGLGSHLERKGLRLATSPYISAYLRISPYISLDIWHLERKGTTWLIPPQP